MAVAEAADRTVRRASQATTLLHAPVLGIARLYRNDLELSAADIAAVRTRAGARFAVAAVEAGTTIAADIARVLSAGEDGNGGAPPPSVVLLEPIDRFGAAARAAAAGPVVLVIAASRTRAEAVTRARGLLADAGATVAGAVLVVVGPRLPADAWS
jgi:hypothetical protein